MKSQANKKLNSGDKDPIAKLRRQLTLLGIAAYIPKTNKETFYRSVQDVAVLFDVSDLTINRDSADLRDAGIPIHSNKTSGLHLEKTLNDEQLIRYINNLIGVSNSQENSDKATSLLVSKHQSFAYYLMALLHIAIEQGLKVTIRYVKDNNSDSKALSRAVQPVALFQRDHAWRIMTKDRNQFKQFRLDKIRDIELLSDSFEKPAPQTLKSLFDNSWASWTGDKRYDVVITLSQEWTEKLRHQQLIENQLFTINEDGSSVFTATVNSLHEVASWLLGLGKGAVVIAPDELKQEVITLAQNVLHNYK